LVRDIGHSGCRSRSASCISIVKLNHVVDENLIALSEEHLVCVNLRFHRRYSGGSTPVSRSCFDSFMKLVEDLVGACWSML
jgi:hypothetical protein